MKLVLTREQCWKCTGKGTVVEHNIGIPCDICDGKGYHEQWENLRELIKEML